MVQVNAPGYGALSPATGSGGTAAAIVARSNPPLTHKTIDAMAQEVLKRMILETGISLGRLVTTAWAAASTFRCSDKRGGINGARIQLEPQKNWLANEPGELAIVLHALEKIQATFNATSKQGKVSMADLIALSGCAAVEEAAREAGYLVTVPFTPGRTDATQEMTDVESFHVLEPLADGFRNYVREGVKMKPEELLLDKASLLSLTAPEMAVLIGGLRVLEIGTRKSSSFTHRAGLLTNDFFINMLDNATVWKSCGPDLYEGRDRCLGHLKWTGTRVDLTFGSNSVLRALSEFYASSDAEEQFVTSFCAAFGKVMNLDRDYDLSRSGQSNL